MKRIALFLLVLVIPLVNATILLDDLDREVYNIGDRVGVSGYILENKDVFGRFQLDLMCDEANTLVVRGFNIKKGDRFDFDENLPLFFPSEGRCKVIATLLEGSKVIDQAETEVFQISRKLIGNFTINDNLIQLGKSIEIDGTISKFSGGEVNGIASVFFIQENEVFFVDTIDFSGGVFSYELDSKDSLPGDYVVDVEVSDVFGNKQLFEGVVKFTLVNEISVLAEVNKESVLPGTSVTVFGEADTILQDIVKEGDVTIFFGGEQFNTRIKKGGQFDYRLGIPEDIKSGKQQIRVVVVDSFGNRGESETSVEILPIPSRLDVEFEGKTYLPGESLVFKPILYDQAGELVDELVRVQIMNSEKNIIIEREIKSNTESEFIFLDSSIPGTWRIKLIHSNLEEEKEFFVGNLAALDYIIDEGVLIVENIGNVRYEDPIEIRIKGGGVDLSLTKKTSIKPGGRLRIDLGREVESGVYDVIVGEDIFEDVEIIGSERRIDFSLLYWVLIILGVILFVYFLFFRTKRMILKRVKEKRMLKRIKKEREPEDYKKEFRRQILRQIEDRDKAIRRRLHFGSKKSKKNEGFMILGKEQIKKEEKEKEDKKDGGLFSMFD